jgi:hypothetical protein
MEIHTEVKFDEKGSPCKSGRMERMAGERKTRSKSSIAWMKLFILFVFVGGLAIFFLFGGERYRVFCLC